MHTLLSWSPESPHECVRRLHTPAMDKALASVYSFIYFISYSFFRSTVLFLILFALSSREQQYDRKSSSEHIKGIFPVEAKQHVSLVPFDHFWQLSQPLHFAARQEPLPPPLPQPPHQKSRKDMVGRVQRTEEKGTFQNRTWKSLMVSMGGCQWCSWWCLQRLPFSMVMFQKNKPEGNRLWEGHLAQMNYAN